MQDKFLKKSDMKPFGTMKVCPKCGHDDFEVIYNPNFSLFDSDKVLIPEHLQITCNFCSFIKNELPLDARAE